MGLIDVFRFVRFTVTADYTHFNGLLMPILSRTQQLVILTCGKSREARFCTVSSGPIMLKLKSAVERSKSCMLL